jgi:hypothetical protein
MPRKILTSLVGALAAVGVVLGAFTLPAHATTADVVVKATIVEHADNGHGTPAHWATDSFTRTLTIHQSGPHAYTLTTTDSGSFTTIKGAGDPAGHGVPIKRILTGSFASTGSGTATGDLISNPQSKSGKIYDDVHGTPFPGSGTWADQFFASGATVNPFDSYRFTYTTADEQWVDASTNNDGQDQAAGDITGKLSSKLVIGPCTAKTTQTWKVSNVRGDRARTVTWWTYDKGVRSAGHKTVVPAYTTVILHTDKSHAAGIHYYNGYNVSEWAWSHCAPTPRLHL